MDNPFSLEYDARKKTFTIMMDGKAAVPPVTSKDLRRTLGLVVNTKINYLQNKLDRAQKELKAQEQTMFESLSEVVRTRRYVEIMDEQLAAKDKELKDALQDVEYEQRRNRNLEKWIEIKGVSSYKDTKI